MEPKTEPNKQRKLPALKKPAKPTKSSIFSFLLLNLGLFMTALGISLHNLPEGLVVFNATVVGVCKLPPPSSFSLAYLFQYLTQCTGRGLVVALAIAIHNIPEGIAVALPLYYSTRSKWEAMKWCLLSSICEPVAAILFGVFFHAYLTERLMAIMNAVVAGIMIILCVFELIPSALQFTSTKVGLLIVCE